MNKRYASILALTAVCGAVVAQHSSRELRIPNAPVERRGHTTTPVQGDRAVLWQDDFSVPSNWTTEIAGFPEVEWQIGQGLESTGTYGTPAIQSSTAGNGYAMLCSDCGANQDGTDYEKNYMTTANPIDLSASPNVILEFQTMYRRFNNEQTYVAISTDGVTWPQPPGDTATVGLPDGLYPVWKRTDLSQGIAVPNPTIKRINISAAAGGQSTIWVRFYWYGIWGYAWYVDDVNIFEQLPYDLGLASNFISHTGDGNEFGRVPVSQLGTNLNLGGEIANFGINDQTNVVLNVETRNSANDVVLNYSTAAQDVPSGTSLNLNEDVTISAWPIDTYTTTMWVTSDDQASDGDPVNDTIVRVFEVTQDVYSLDGVGVYPENTLSGLGTNSFPFNLDGMYCFTNYFVRENFTVYGMYIGLRGNGRSFPGAVIQASLHDTTDVFADDPTAPFVSSAEHSLTDADTTDRFVVLPFAEPFTLEPGTGYLAGVKLFSSNGATHVSILDDFTVLQPGSFIYLPEPTAPGDQPGTAGNGNAFVLRLLADPTIGMEERDELEGVNVFPNPTSGLVNLTFTVPGAYTVELINALGEMVSTHRLNGNNTINLSDLAKGVYSVRISNKEKTTVQRISLN